MDVSACSFAATLVWGSAEFAYPVGEIKVYPLPIGGDAARMQVEMTADGDNFGEPTDQRGFFLQAFC